MAEIDRIAPTKRPSGDAQGYQSWRRLLFLHWAVDPAVIRPLIPDALELDLWEGKAWVGVVAFKMENVRPLAWAPPAPFASEFLELNVRTYVHHHDGNPGVWFLSLDAASSLAVVAARAGWSLPYFRASMEEHVNGDAIQYESKRQWPDPTPADLFATYRVADPLGTSPPGTFQHFLAERYILYAQREDGPLQLGRVHHPAYPLVEVADLRCTQSMTNASGIEVAGAPHALFSPGVDVEIFALEDVPT